MKKSIACFALFFSIIGASFLLSPSRAEAVTAADWMPGRIVDDSVFFNPYTMSTQDIQVFLNSKGTSCTSNCLKDYSQDTPAVAADAYCSAISGGFKSAAAIIKDVTMACSMNPQAMLVLIQKEQGLVTATGTSYKYKFATGFCVYDTTPPPSCIGTDGFFNQIYYGARQFQKYAKLPNSFNFAIGRTSFVQYSPTASCGGMDIYMQTKATAGLYNYTPYQPNQTTLNAGWGTAYCGAYGNRNFWLYFHSWFGSPYRVNGTINLSQGLSFSASGTKYIGDTVTASYEVENTATYDVYVGGLGVCGRINGQNYDFGFIHHNSIAAGGKKTITFSKKLDTAGTLNVFLCSYYEGVGGWASDRYPYDSAAPMTRQATINVADNPFITSDLILGPANPGIHQSVTAYTSIKNASEIDINIGSLVIAARDPLGRNVDFPIKNDVIIPANSTVNLTWTRTFTMPGNYSFHIANWNGVWRTDYPKSANNFVIRQLNWPILDNPLISSGITVTTPTPTAGQPVDVTLTFRNTSGSDINIGSVVIAARNSTGGNVDFPLKNDVIIPANNTKTFTWTRTLSSPGTYSLFVANWNGVWTTSYPKSMNESVQRQTTINVN